MIHIYSDPHIGKNLTSHTTSESRRRLRNYISQHTAEIVDDFGEDGTILCAGDFFDTYSNSEDVLYSSMWAANKTSKILTGNHDVINIADRKGTLDIIGTVFDARVVPCKFGKVNYQYVYQTLPSNTHIVMVPHHSSQALFEDALEDVLTAAMTRKEDRHILIAHCNYDSPFIHDDVTLNMTSKMAQRLLTGFEYIFLGHEHTHRTDHDNRLIVVGSPHPTGFGDISDKFVVSLLEDGGYPILKQTWSQHKNYLECDWKDVMVNLTVDHQFIKLTGEVTPSDIHSLASVIRRVWKDFLPFAIKSEVKILSGESSVSTLSRADTVRINEIIESELKGSPELYELWKEITNAD
jgi:DNA repair exonuclease SbcCD nuclease subunit